jgi:hypothetical protein
MYSPLNHQEKPAEQTSSKGPPKRPVQMNFFLPVVQLSATIATR